MNAARSWWSSKAWVFIVLAMLVLPFVMTLGMTRGLTHDEHQHVAAGELLAQSGLLPYRDFAYFHTPYLPFIYAGIFYFTDHLLLGSRLFSVACAVASLAVLGLVIFQLFRDRRTGIAWAAAIGGVALAVFSPVFVETAGHAWNQEPALLFALLAFLAHLAGIPGASGRRLFLAGALLGLAIGLRITFAPLFAPFVIALWMIPETRGRRTSLITAFSAGVAVSLSGLACLFLAAPEQTWFANFGFAGVNITYRFNTGEPRTMTLLKKLRYVFKEIMRPDAWLMLASLVSFGALFISRHFTKLKLPLGFRFVLLSIPFLLIGSFAPSPMFEQYFYPFVFFLPLGAAYALAALPSGSPWLRRAAIGSGLGVLIAVCMGARDYKNVTQLADVQDWDPIKIHEEGVEIRKQIGSGEILTLAPTYAMEGGAKTYPSFATGPFAWRVSPYIEAGKAARLKITTFETLKAMLDANPPEGILLGKEKRGEEAFERFAIDNGYTKIVLREDDRLWIPKKVIIR